MNSKDLAIGVLSVTAVILLAALVIVQAVLPPPAMGFGQGTSGGDYVVSTAQLDDTTEMIFIVDSVAQQMNMYGFVAPLGVVELIQTMDLRVLDRLSDRPADRDRGVRDNR